jgi:hypothetical protein
MTIFHILKRDPEERHLNQYPKGREGAYYDTSNRNSSSRAHHGWPDRLYS